MNTHINKHRCTGEQKMKTKSARKIIDRLKSDIGMTRDVLVLKKHLRMLYNMHSEMKSVAVLKYDQGKCIEDEISEMGILSFEIAILEADIEELDI